MNIQLGHKLKSLREYVVKKPEASAKELKGLERDIVLHDY